MDADLAAMALPIGLPELSKLDRMRGENVWK